MVALAAGSAPHQTTAARQMPAAHQTAAARPSAAAHPSVAARPSAAAHSRERMVRPQRGSRGYRRHVSQKPAVVVAAPRPRRSAVVPAPALPTIYVDAVASSAAAAEEDMAGGGTALQTNTPVPTLDGHSTMGYAWWSYLPMGFKFRAMGHVYVVVGRVWLSVSGGQVLDSAFGGDFDLHTCTPSGSTLTWTRMVG